MGGLHLRNAQSATRSVPPKARIVPHLVPRLQALGSLRPITGTRMTGGRRLARSSSLVPVPFARVRCQLLLPKHHSSQLSSRWFLSVAPSASRESACCPRVSVRADAVSLRFLLAPPRARLSTSDSTFLRPPPSCAPVCRCSLELAERPPTLPLDHGRTPHPLLNAADPRSRPTPCSLNE